MKEEFSLIQYSNNIERYLHYPFTLSNLIDMIPSCQIFELETFEIFINEEQNFTFNADWYTVKLRNSEKQIQKRVLYYSILCYIFQICGQQQHEIYYQRLVNYVLNNVQIIFPYKSRPQQKVPLLTTNQLKSCFIKFLSLLKQKCKKYGQKKIIIQQIMIIPQIDYIFMSIFNMLIKDNYLQNQKQQQKLKNYFGFTINKICEDSFTINSQIQIQIIRNNSKKKIQMKKSKSTIQTNSNQKQVKFKIKKLNKIKMKRSYNNINTTTTPIKKSILRRQTIQSIGGINQDQDQYNYTNPDKILYQFSSDELNNAKFVHSFKLQKGKQLINLSFIDKQLLNDFNISQQNVSQSNKGKQLFQNYNKNTFNYNFKQNQQELKKQEQFFKRKTRNQNKFKTFCPSNFNKDYRNLNMSKKQNKNYKLNQNSFHLIKQEQKKPFCPIITIKQPIQDKQIKVINKSKYEKTFNRNRNVQIRDMSKTYYMAPNMFRSKQKRINKSNQQISQQTISSSSIKDIKGKQEKNKNKFKPWDYNKNKFKNSVQINEMNQWKIGAMMTKSIKLNTEVSQNLYVVQPLRVKSSNNLQLYESKRTDKSYDQRRNLTIKHIQIKQIKNQNIIRIPQRRQNKKNTFNYFIYNQKAY